MQCWHLRLPMPASVPARVPLTCQGLLSPAPPQRRSSGPSSTSPTRWPWSWSAAGWRGRWVLQRRVQAAGDGCAAMGAVLRVAGDGAPLAGGAGGCSSGMG